MPLNKSLNLKIKFFESKNEKRLINFISDDISVTTYDDTTSLPDDPFPQGLPSLCMSSNEDLSSSSTLGSNPR